LLVVTEVADRIDDHVAAIGSPCRRGVVEFVNVLREPWTALGNSPKSTLRYCNFNGRAAVENEVVSISSMTPSDGVESEVERSPSREHLASILASGPRR
jgi:hypothetical protein